MGKLLVLVLVLGGVAAAAALVPIRGLTLLDRWALAPDTHSFLTRGYDELKAALPGSKPHQGERAAPHKLAKPQARKAAPVPVEHHTDEDRAALDRIVAQSARK